MKTTQLPGWVLNITITIGLAVIATVLSFLLFLIQGDSSANITILYVLAVMVTARYTTGYRYGILASLIGVVCINFFFTYPYLELNFTLTGYPVIFVGTLTISVMTSAMTTLLKQQRHTIQEREKQLLEAEKEKMRANLLRAISHDLRTPLTGIIGNSEMYLDHEDKLDNDAKRELVQRIREDANWLLNMVENLLSVTRIQTDSLEITRSLESVEEVVSEALIRLRKRLPEAKVTVRVPEEILMIPMDAMLIEQVIINLLENAIVHSKSDRPVECIVDFDEEWVYFHVKDYGIGLDEARLPTLFDGGIDQRDSGADVHKGMGIGLSICQTIVRAHHGSIYGENHEQGAIFTCKLPKEETIYAGQGDSHRN